MEVYTAMFDVQFNKIKDTEALKKTLEHLDIIYKDLLSIFSKNNIEPIISLNKKLDPNLHKAIMKIKLSY